MTVCNECGGTVIEYDVAAGNGFCVGCGTVVEEGMVVNEIAFGETSNGAAMVQGSYVAQGATRARMAGPYGNRGNSESREQTIANATRKIQSIANALRLSEVVQLAATRLYTLAVEHKFTKGRKSLNVVAVCLYVACRQKETKTYMLIDFSDLLQVNVFELGHTYLQLVQTLNLRLPLVDPSHYISRFASLLEFGDETPRVATDAVRLVQRFDRDWMTRGRRPSGICGAALLLAARMNNFRRSVEEVVQVVKIADTTLKKRLDEFRKTESAGLSVGDFRNVWLEDEHDPPAFTKGREKEEAERREAEEEAERLREKAERAKQRAERRARGEEVESSEEEDAEVVLKGKKGKKKGKGRGKDADKGEKKGKDKSKAKGKGKKRKREEDGDAEGDGERDAEGEPDPSVQPQPPQFDPNLLAEGILAGAFDGLSPGATVMGPPAGNPITEQHDVDLSNIDPVLLQQGNPAFSIPRPAGVSGPSSISSPSSIPTPLSIPTPSSSGESLASGPPTTTGSSVDGSTPTPILVDGLIPMPSPSETTLFNSSLPPLDALDKTAESVLTEEVSTFLHTQQGEALTRALDEAEQKRDEQRARREEERTRRLERRRKAREERAADGYDYGDQYERNHEEEEEEEDLLEDLDEDELDKFILSPAEVKIKERVWVEINREYLEALVAKGDQADNGASKSRKRRKTANKPRDASTPAGASAADSVRNLIKKNPKYSKRINYDALKDLFVDSGSTAGIRNPATFGDNKDDDEVYTFDADKSDGEGAAPMVIIEEGEASVLGAKPGVKPLQPDLLEDEGSEDEKDDEDMDVDQGWDEGYEQEV